MGGRARFFVLPETGRDTGLVGFLPTLSKVGACHLDLALICAYTVFYIILFGCAMWQLCSVKINTVRHEFGRHDIGW